MEIEKLDLEVKTYNRIKKVGINTTDELLIKMYEPEGLKIISQPDMRRIEVAMKDKGIIKYMRGDPVNEVDIEPEPLTWDELHGYKGKLVVHDISTESRRHLIVCWIYDIHDEGEGNLIYISTGTHYAYARRSSVNGEFQRDPEYLKRHKHLKNEGRFFKLAERIDEFSNHAPNFGKEARRLLDERKNTNAMIEPQMKTPPADVKAAVTDKYTEAYNLNVRICVNAQMAQQNLYEVCKGLKEMRDGKLYKELGYQNFEDYAENEVGISRMQCHKYATIADTFDENVNTSLHKIGVSKLYLLAKLDEPQREKIQQTVNVEEVSVRELKAEIDKLNEEKAGYKERQNKLLTRNKQLVSELETAEKKRDKAESDLGEARDTVQSLEKQIEELENKPRDSFEDTTRINELTTKLEEEQQRHAKELERLRSEYEKKPEKAVDNSALFKVYMQATVDSMKRLTVFCEQNANAPERELFIGKLETIVQLTNQTITKLKGE